MKRRGMVTKEKSARKRMNEKGSMCREGDMETEEDVTKEEISR